MIDFSKITTSNKYVASMRSNYATAKFLYQLYKESNGSDNESLYNCLLYLHEIDESVDVDSYSDLAKSKCFEPEAFKYCRKMMNEIGNKLT